MNHTFTLLHRSSLKGLIYQHPCSVLFSGRLYQLWVHHLTIAANFFSAIPSGWQQHLTYHPSFRAGHRSPPASVLFFSSVYNYFTTLIFLTHLE